MHSRFIGCRNTSPSSKLFNVWDQTVSQLAKSSHLLLEKLLGALETRFGYYALILYTIVVSNRVLHPGRYRWCNPMDNRKLDPEGWNPTIRSRMDHEESPILNPSNSQNEYWMKFTKLAAGTSYLSRDFVVDHLICTEHGIYHKLADNHRGAKAHYNKLYTQNSLCDWLGLWVGHICGFWK